MLDVGVRPAARLRRCWPRSAFAVFAFAYIRRALAKIPNPVRTQLWLDDPTHAEELVRECEEALRDPH